MRDSKFRNTDAETTFAHWGGVVSNELVNIEPYKDGCDVRLNSGMIYEICVLKDPLIEVLNRISETDSHYVTAKLLMEKLGRFPTVSADYVPQDSVLREFIGS